MRAKFLIESGTLHNRHWRLRKARVVTDVDAVMDITHFEFSFPLFLICLLFRSFDAISTYLLTPRLLNEANLLAKGMGWKGTLALNGVMCVFIAYSLFYTIIICTVSILVTAENLSSFVLARGLGEERALKVNKEVMKNASYPAILFTASSTGAIYVGLGALLLFFSDSSILFTIALGFGLFGLIITLHWTNSMVHTKRKAEKEPADEQHGWKPVRSGPKKRKGGG